MKLGPWLSGMVMVAGSLLLSRAALADQTFCIDPGHQPTSLFNALQTWLHGSGEQITIKVVGGTIGISVNMTQLNTPSDSLVLLGGYQPNSGCNDNFRNITSNVTVLDGEGTGAFAMEPGAPFTVDGVTFAHYYGGTADQGGGPRQGVIIDAIESGVTMTRFIADEDATFDVSSQNGALTFHDCLVKNQPLNAIGPAMRVGVEDNAAFVQNCTITNNANGGLQMDTFGDGQLVVYNTISFDNANGGAGGNDMSTVNVSNAPNVYFSFFQSGSGFNSFSNQGPPPSNYVVFAGPGDYHLGQGSLAINAGDPNVTYSPNETDLDGNPRVVGGRIDIGAYESNFVPNQYIVTKTTDDGSLGTLRWAINQANAANAGFANIIFNLGTASGCPYLISLEGVLPDITVPLIIDGTTQPGWVANNQIGAFSGTLCVRITSGTGSSLTYGLHTASTPVSSSLVARGLIFDDFNEGVLLEGGSGHNIGGNRFSGPSLHSNAFAILVGGASGSAQIGGADPAYENVVDNSEGFVASGIYLSNSDGGNLVQGNLIGVAPDGTTAQPNAYGIFISDSPNNTVRGNYIGYSNYDGIAIYGAAASGNLVQQNYIGWDFYGAMPNGRYGVDVDGGANANSIGNANFFTASFANSIRNSGSAGVMLTSAAGTGNYVLGNDLVGNGGPSANNGLAIDLGTLGPTANAPLNPQNVPVLRNSFAMPNNQLIAGTLDAAPGTFYRIDFYHLNTTPIGYAGRGDAGLFVGAKGLTTDANGHCSFLLIVPQVDVGGWLSAATTPLSGNTSEISNAVPDQLDGIFADGFGGVDSCQ